MRWQREGFHNLGVALLGGMQREAAEYTGNKRLSLALTY
jgi:hypothetical protein